MSECVFCKIIKGELPAVKMYEDDDFIVIQALYQAVKGHSLIIPKVHAENILEDDPAIGTKLLALTQKICKASMKGLGATGINISNNVGKDSGQVIFHTHIHIMPRFAEDGRKHWPESEASEEDRTLYAQKIISAIE